MTRFVRSFAFATAALLVASSCNVERPVAPKSPGALKFDGAASNITTPSVVISQIYGGGGNTSAPFKNDFVELFNPGTVPVNISGWSIQYASATGTSWQQGLIPSGAIIPPGGYYLIAEAAGTGAAPALPTPDAAHTIAMAAGGGKVWLLSGTWSVIGGACPVGPLVVDKVVFGSGANLCVTDIVGSTPAVGNTTAAIRNGGGCTYTGNLATDFAAATPTPRNSATPPAPCGGPVIIPLSGTGAANPSTLSEGNSTLLTVSITSSGPGTTISVVADLSSIGGSNAAPMFDNGTSGDVTAGDLVFSLSTSIALSTTPGSKTLPVALSDNEARTGTTSISLTVVAPPAPPADLVISQVFGAGGNSGATLTNDYIEIFNRGNTAVNLSGWSVQYISANGTGNWATTPLTGTIPAHGYYLVQEVAGAGGTTPLPTPDAIGSIAMGGSAGKVALSNSTTALNGACPSGPSVIDRVGYGTGDAANVGSPGTELEFAL